MNSVGCILILLFLFLSHLGFSVDTDFCNVDKARCSKEGIYQYKWATGYEDFILRDLLDDDVETVKTDPMLALEKANNTLLKHPYR